MGVESQLKRESGLGELPLPSYHLQTVLTEGFPPDLLSCPPASAPQRLQIHYQRITPREAVQENT